MRLFNLFWIDGAWQKKLTAEVRRAFLFFPAYPCVLCGYYQIDSSPYWFLQSPCHRSPLGRQCGSQPCRFVRVWNRRWTQINTDIAAKIRLYLNFHNIIKIKIHTCRYLCLSVVNYEIGIIPGCFLSAHAQSVGREVVCDGGGAMAVKI